MFIHAAAAAADDPYTPRRELTGASFRPRLPWWWRGLLSLWRHWFLLRLIPLLPQLLCQPHMSGTMRPCVAVTVDKCDPFLVGGSTLAQKGKDIISDLGARTRCLVSLPSTECGQPLKYCNASYSCDRTKAVEENEKQNYNRVPKSRRVNLHERGTRAVGAPRVCFECRHQQEWLKATHSSTNKSQHLLLTLPEHRA